MKGFILSGTEPTISGRIPLGRTHKLSIFHFTPEETLGKAQKPGSYAPNCHLQHQEHPHLFDYEGG